MQEKQNSEAAPDTAIIAIHGVGDPKPGDTAEALARLLAAQAGYTHEGSDNWVVPVHAVHPTSAAAPVPSDWISYASPFVAARMGTHRTEDDDPRKDEGDLGIQLNYHLLRGTRLTDGEQTYESRRHRLAKAGRTIDVLDLYWGDLSGLDDAVRRILTELYTLIFHLSQLGRDTVHHTALYLERAHPAHAWATVVLARSQQLAAALFTKPTGVLNALLLMLALWWLPLVGLHGALGVQAPSSGWLAVSGSVLVAATGAAWLAAWYRGWRGASLGAALVVTALLAALGWLAGQHPQWLPHAVAALWGVALAAAFAAFMGFCEPRVRGVRRWGLWTGGATVLAMLAGGWWGAPMATDAPSLWASMVMTAIDGVMAALLITWALMAVAAISLVASGAWLKWQCRDPVVTRGVDTGRFGLFASIAMFVTLTCAAWNFAIDTVAGSLHGFSYPSALSGVSDAARMIREHFATSTLMFSPLLLLLALLLLGAACVLVPSIACEFGAPPAGRDGTRLGRWLTRVGTLYVHLASKLVFFSTGIFVLWALYAMGRLHIDVGPVARASAQTLKLLSYALAGGAAGLLVVGSRVFGSLGKLRLALDAALDVDRHFREFPDDATPRGRIAARLYSVLLAARDAGYGRIVISAHSQGVVITTELLRYLKARKPEVLAGLPPIHLFTCGAPLRQLYASRFPALYPWTNAPFGVAGGVTGPGAALLGVVRWTNAYCTGDYIGRWLWAPEGADLLATGRNYEDDTHRQWCLGKGAHTHYYDARMAQVAAEIDRLSQ